MIYFGVPPDWRGSIQIVTCSPFTPTRVVYPTGMGRIATKNDNDTGVVARLGGAESPLETALAQWADYLAGRGRRPQSIRQFRENIAKAASELEWRTPADVTFQAVTGWIAARVNSKRWRLNTGDAALAAFRSFTRWAAAANVIEKDPLILAHGSGADDQPGARVPSTEDARVFIRVTLATQKRDKRSTGNRALYWYLMFMHGLRFSELGGAESNPLPRGWRWGDLSLDARIPVVRWSDDMHKGARHCVLPLHPTAARLLKEHRETVPHAAGDPVFPIVPTRGAWRKDRARAGVAEKDDAGRAFSPHSARKWCRTALTRAGVQTDIIDLLIRHANDLRDRYLELEVATLHAALLKLPDLWPEENGGGSQKMDLTDPGGASDTSSATHAGHPRNNASTPDRGPQVGPHVSLRENPARPRSGAEALLAEFGERLGRLNPAQVGDDNRHCRTQNDVDSRTAAIADLLRAVARLLDGV